MHYASFDQWNYPTRTVVSVRRENINMDAIKELTNKVVRSIAFNKAYEDMKMHSA